MTVVLRTGRQGPPGPQGPAGPPGTSGILTTKGDLLTRDVTTEVRLPVGTDGQVLEADSATAEGLAFKTRPATTPLTTKGDVLTHDGATTVRVSVGTDGQVLTANSVVSDGVDWQTPVDAAHALGGAQHTGDTLANLNTKVTDATLDDSGDSRPPDPHAFAGADHTTSNLAAVNTKITDATLDDSGDSRTPTSHPFAGGLHSGSTLADVNSKITDATLDDAGDPRPPAAHDLDDHGSVTLGALNSIITSGDLDLEGTPRPPLSHALGGGSHTADSLANLNSKVTDATLDDSGDSRPPSGAAGGELSGTYPSPTVDDGADGSAIHDNLPGEITAIGIKATPVSADTIVAEDSAAADAKVSMTLGSIMGILPPAAHALGGAEHTADTLANLNSKVTDATLDDAGDARPPTSHALGTAHSADTLFNLNAKVSDATLDDAGDSRPPDAHALAGADHTADTLANLNSKVSDATLDDAGDSRPPDTHALGGAAHSADTLANLNTKVSDATLDDSGDSRPPTAHTHVHDDGTGINENNHHNRAHSITGVADHSFPGGTTTFLRADGTFAVPVSGGGVQSLQYEFSTSVTIGNPGAGILRFNNALYASVTSIFINDTAKSPVYDIGTALSELQVGDLLSFAELDDPTSAAIYSVVSTTDNTGWWTIGVTHVQNGGGDLIADGANVWVSAFLKIVRPHGLEDHESSTLAELNSTISDAVLDDENDPRPPTAHTHTHASTTGQTANDHHSQAHAMGGADHTADTFANVNSKVSDEDLVALANHLGGTAALPQVVGLQTTTGPTSLTLGAWADGEVLTRSGSTAVGSVIMSGGGIGGAISGTWRYSTTTTSGDPGNGRVRTNSTVLASVTEMYIDVLADSPAFDFGNIFNSLVPGDVVIIQENGDATSAGEYTIDSITDETGWYTFELTHIKNAGGDDIQNNAPTTVAFVKIAALIGTEEWTWADDLTVPVTADWAINVVAPLSEDSLNSAIHALMFDDTTEEGGACRRTVPTGAARMIFKTWAKPDSAPPGAETAVYHLRFREIKDNAAIGAWGTPVPLTDIDFGANAFHQLDITDNDLATWGIAVGGTYQILISRDVADIDDDLDDDCGIVGVGTAWTT